MKGLKIFFAFLIGVIVCLAEEACDVSEDEITKYKEVVEKITKAVSEGDYKNQMYDSLTMFVDKFGGRMTGTPFLEQSIQYLSNLSTANGFKPILDPVKVPVWIRGKESASVITQYNTRKLRIKGLGLSPGGNITAELIVVKGFDELQENQAKVAGKIVLFNAEFVNYTDTVSYRNTGPAKASKLGAVGALVRSVTPFSIGSLHAGVTIFDNGTTPIPAAAITLEDADMLARLFESNETLSIHLKMNHTTLKEEGESFNLINDLTGAVEPESYVTISGHIDSWDVGKGALDDGGGAFLALHTVFLLKSLELHPPRRTIRSILWTGEEQGLIGAKSYAKTHAEELKNWTVAFESDEGLFDPIGLKLAGSDKAKCVLEQILKQIINMNVSKVEKADSAGSDITVFKDLGVPLIEPLMVENNYFWFHHSDGDSMRTLDSTIMNKNLILAACVMYILADIQPPFPRSTAEEKRNEAPATGPPPLGLGPRPTPARDSNEEKRNEELATGPPPLGLGPRPTPPRGSNEEKQNGATVPPPPGLGPRPTPPRDSNEEKQNGVTVPPLPGLGPRPTPPRDSNEEKQNGATVPPPPGLGPKPTPPRDCNDEEENGAPETGFPTSGLGPKPTLPPVHEIFVPAESSIESPPPKRYRHGSHNRKH